MAPLEQDIPAVTLDGWKKHNSQNGFALFLPATESVQKSACDAYSRWSWLTHLTESSNMRQGKQHNYILLTTTYNTLSTALRCECLSNCQERLESNLKNLQN